MEPISGTAVVKAAISAAIKHLPKLAQGGRLTPELRDAAYGRFTLSVWAIASSIGSVRAIEPFARPKINFYHRMFRSLLETSMKVQGEFLGAFGALRLVAPTVVADAAMRVAICVGELADVQAGDSISFDERQSDLGSAMIDFTLLCRIDLGVARHPSAPRILWYGPASWVRGARWWLKARRGDWPVLPADAVKQALPERPASSASAPEKAQIELSTTKRQLE